MIELLNIDCMVYMKGLPDKAFDLAIVDPPYGIGEDGRNNHTRGKLAKAKDYRKNSRYDSNVPGADYFEQLKRVSKNQIIWGGNYFIHELDSTPCFIVWDKNNGDNDFADCELAWTSFKTSVRRFKYTWNGMLQQNMKDKEERIHPNHKPVTLYKWLLHNYAKPICNNKHTEEYKSLCTDCNKPFRILDTHLGSGSSAIAAHSMGFDFVGCELDKDYYDAACKRFREQTMQQKLFI